MFLENSHETTGDKLLQSYQRLRLENIIITSFSSRQFFNPFLIDHLNVLLILLFGFSFIAVVPPTPPPFKEVPSFNRSEVKRTICIIIFFFMFLHHLIIYLCAFAIQDPKISKPFTKSMENLMMSVSAHIKSKRTKLEPFHGNCSM